MFSHFCAYPLTNWLHRGTIDDVNQFDDAAPELVPIHEDEEFTPDERLRRRLAFQTSPWSRRGGPKVPEGATADERRAIYAAWLEDLGLQAEEEARTDAVTAVEYETDDWRVRWVLAEQSNAVVVRALTIEPRARQTPPGGVTSNLLRELRPARAATAGAAHFAAPPTEYGARSDDLFELFARQARRSVQESDLPTEQVVRRTGRPPLSDAYLATVARAYLEELPHGRGLLRRLGERFDRTPETMRDQVRIARRAGFLSNDAQVGRRGATAGPRLQEIERQAATEVEDDG